MSKTTYMIAKCTGCLKVVTAEVFQDGEGTEPFYEEYEGKYIIEESQTLPMLDGCQCKQELSRLRAANAELVGEMRKCLLCMTSNGMGEWKEAKILRAALSRAEQAKPEPRSETCVWTPQGGAWFRDCARATSMWEAVPAVCPVCCKRIEVKG